MLRRGNDMFYKHSINSHLLSLFKVIKISNKAINNTISFIVRGKVIISSSF